MAIMYPRNLEEYLPTNSERIVYLELKNQLPDSCHVFYSVRWSSYSHGTVTKSEADFVVVHPDYGFLCLEVKGGAGIKIEDNIWTVIDKENGDRKLAMSPYQQAEKSMYFFRDAFANKYSAPYCGVYGYGVVFPFYAVSDDLNLDKQHRGCTIDSRDLNIVETKIRGMFRQWAGHNYGKTRNPASQHNAFLELIRERIAISAAAGALVKYKEKQLDVINRIQDNFVYFLKNVRQFYIRGGAGTGKTWIAFKIAQQEAERDGSKVLYLCKSGKLAEFARNYSKGRFDVKTLEDLTAPTYEHGDSTARFHGWNAKYDAIFVDEAQDFSAGEAEFILLFLRDPLTSRLGIFYDDVQIFREESFGDGFHIKLDPFLLRENIRNTATIYNWTAEKTNLGTDVIANPVEGPTPCSERIDNKDQLTLRLEGMLRRYLDEEHLPNESIVILSDDPEQLMKEHASGIAKWRFTREKPSQEAEISVYSVEEYKGLEADMVIYIRSAETTDNTNYIAYTRARYYLIELIRNY